MSSVFRAIFREVIPNLWGWSVTPNTAAGRALVEDEPMLVLGPHSMLERVLAIEAQAVAAERKRLRDERRAYKRRWDEAHPGYEARWREEHREHLRIYNREYARRRRANAPDAGDPGGRA